ncbi:MAG: TonB-dependent receptor [Candidatus Solibacter usitatus]|nr:TonB-dependent receptor [Candidatus Solibacter usitatus]
MVCVFLFGGVVSRASELVKGTVLDPSGSPIDGADIAAVSRLGVVAQTRSDAAGEFRLALSELAGVRLTIAAPGFAMQTVDPAGAVTVRLAIAPQTDSVKVIGSLLDVPLSAQGSSASLISREAIRQRNEAQAYDLLRDLPGVSVSQSGQRGGVTSMFTRGGISEFMLVQIDGIAVNAFGGGFDFANIPTDFLDHIDVIRGPQSAVYGSYANSGVVDFVTRRPGDQFSADVIAEGGTYGLNRFAIAAGGVLGGFGLSASASSLETNGPVENSDYRNQNLFLGVNRAFGRQYFRAIGLFNSNEAGSSGPYGSNPAGIFSGIDLISRGKNNFSAYGVHYRIDLTSQVRQELMGNFFLNNSFFQSPFGGSYNKDLRGQAETRTIVSVTPNYSFAVGAAFSREQVQNTFITDVGGQTFPLDRDQGGFYWENRLQLGGRLFLNAGLRAELIHTPQIPADQFGGRPQFPADSIVKVNPKISIAYVLPAQTRLHASFGTGIRPPGGFELAFTNNPGLRPERTISFDAGLEQRLFHDHVSLGGTYFFNRYEDLIVTLGGSLAELSSFQSANLANSRAQGAELTARWRPARQFALSANYMYLDSEILALDKSSSLAPQFYKVGQPLTRRPRNSGNFGATYSHRNLAANVSGYFRGSTLDVEPNFGASAGLYNNSGYFVLGLNVNYAVSHGVTVYGNLRNALNRRYEEVFGFPSPLLNFVAGVKWSLPRRT